MSGKHRKQKKLKKNPAKRSGKPSATGGDRKKSAMTKEVNKFIYKPIGKLLKISPNDPNKSPPNNPNKQ